MHKKPVIIITIISLLLLVVGISYAYFTATITGNETASTIRATGGVMTINYDSLSNTITVQNIYPRSEAWLVKEFTVTGTNTTDIGMNYSLTLDITTNTFSSGALIYTLTNNNPSSGTPVEEVENEPIPSGTGEKLLGYGQFETGSNIVHSYTLSIYFLDTGVNQNDDQESRFVARVLIDEEGTGPMPGTYPDGWYTAPSNTLLGSLRESYHDATDAWTIPGQQGNYNGYDGFNFTNCSGKYLTYGTGYEIVDGAFNLTGVSTLYPGNNGIYNLVDKYIAYSNWSYICESTDTPKTNTTGLNKILKVKNIYGSNIYFEEYVILPISSTEANRDWNYATGHEQVGTYSDTRGKFKLTGIVRKNYLENKDDFVGRLLIDYFASSNYSSNPSLDNKTVLYEVVEAEDTYIVYRKPEESIIGKTSDDYGTSYYFRGNIQNNYVVFAGMCWRIVRIDGAGNIKLVLYNYVKTETNPCNNFGPNLAFAEIKYGAIPGLTGGTYTQKFSFNYGKIGTKYIVQYNAGIGYMYGTIDSLTYEEEHANINKSEILKMLIAWYDENIRAGNYDTKLADTIWCNDKRLPENSNFNSANYTDDIINLGYSQIKGYYRGLERVYSSTSLNIYNGTSPSLKCGNNKNDNKISKFTASDTEWGNGALTFNNIEYKIGLLTYDEVLFAGNRLGSIIINYLVDNTDGVWWTMTPGLFSGMSSVFTNSDLKNASENGYLRPAISLKSDVTVTGAGTRTNPYVVN